MICHHLHWSMAFAACQIDFVNKHLQFISIPLQVTIVAPTYMSLQQASTSDHRQPLHFCPVCAWYSACLVSSLAFNGGCARGMFISPLIFETQRSAPVLRQCAESRKRYCDLLQYHSHPIRRLICKVSNGIWKIHQKWTTHLTGVMLCSASDFSAL